LPFADSEERDKDDYLTHNLTQQIYNYFFQGNLLCDHWKKGQYNGSNKGDQYRFVNQYGFHIPCFFKTSDQIDMPGSIWLLLSWAKA
jgi:hypothetical protein